MKGVRYNWARRLCGVALFAPFILWNAGCLERPAAPADLFERVVDGEVFDTTPVRGDVGPLRYEVGPYSFACNDCHADFDAAPIESRPEGAHRAIVDRFNHGADVHCQNCHHPDNREAFVSNVGGEIPSTEANRLCGRCHGLIHRDWAEGLHGRQNGHWDTRFGPRKKLECVQCHDPHDPAFPMMRPEPAAPRSRFEQAHEEREE